MTLLDAPKFDQAKERRKTRAILGGVAVFFLLFIGWWLIAGRPVDWPWHWNEHMMGRMAANNFFKAVEANDLPKAYGVWMHDKNWQQHPQKYSAYSFERFSRDWAPQGVENEYGTITSHRIAVSRVRGNSLMMGVFLNGKNRNAVNMIYFPPDGTLSFTSPDVQFLEGPGGIQ